MFNNRRKGVDIH